MPLSMGEQSGNGATAVTVWLCVLEAAFNNMKTHMSRFWGKSQLHTSRMEDGSSDLPFSRVLHSFPLPWLSLCPKRFFISPDVLMEWHAVTVQRWHVDRCGERTERAAVLWDWTHLVAGGSAWTDTFARYTCRILPSWTYIHFRCMTFLLYNASAFQRVLL